MTFPVDGDRCGHSGGHCILSMSARRCRCLPQRRHAGGGRDSAVAGDRLAAVLACLPFTGLAIIPKSFSAATLLLTMTLLMLIFSAMVVIKEQSEPRWQRVSAQLVLAALWLTPLWPVWLSGPYGCVLPIMAGRWIGFMAR